MAMLSKHDATRKLDSAWGDLMRTIEGITTDDCEKAGVVGDWSIKDLMGHMAFWAGRAANTMSCSAAGHPEDIQMGEGENWVDEWNEREYVARKDVPLAQVRAELMRDHKLATEALENAPEETLNQQLNESPVGEYFAGDTYEHYEQHNQEIQAWQRQLDTSEA